MNSQLSFGSSNLLNGQTDSAEGSLIDEPVKLYYSTDDRATWTYITEAHSVKKDNYAYIYCMYAVTYCPGNYDQTSNKYYCRIPWEYIKDVWEEGYELMVIKNTSAFISYLHDAAEKESLPHAYGLVKYDLEEQQKNKDYLLKAANDPFESVFHKYENPYSVQQEFRFAIKKEDRPDHYELPLSDNATVKVSLLKPNKDKDIIIELSDLAFDENGSPIKFSSELVFYEGNPISSIN